MTGFLASVKEEILRRGIRYVIVGAWNTLFGVGCYTALLLIFPQVHYLVLGIFSNILAITNAFLCYKFFVFKTKGYLLTEYFRCYIVYGGGMLAGMCGMFVCVSLFGFSPVWANLVVTAVVIIGSYCGHRFFSFNHKKKEPEAPR